MKSLPIFLSVSLALAAPTFLHAQESAGDTQPTLDLAKLSWPRTFNAETQDFAVFQPQISTWTDNRISGRFAIGVRTGESKDESYGTVVFSARTSVDKMNRLVTLDEFELSEPNFPTQAAKQSDYLALLNSHLPKATETVALDHLESVFVVSGDVKKQIEVAVKNDPPQMIYTTQPSVLVLIDGPPVLKPLDKVYERVINTPAVLLLNTINSGYYAYAGGRWYKAPSAEGPFAADPNPPADIASALEAALATKKVDPMEPAEGEDAPVLHLYTSTKAAELVQTTGIAQVVPVEGTTSLLYISNTDNALFMDDQDSLYYALISGRWFSSTSLYGPWTFVPSNQLPSDFQKIPSDHPKSNVLASVAGTPQAREAAIATTIPQTASIDRSKAQLEVSYSGQPDFGAIEGTSMEYAHNTATPVIMVNAHNYYANESGVWFVGTSAQGPWEAATSVPAVIYSILPSCPIYYVTSSYVYGATPEYVYTGYTPGYTGAIVAEGGVVVNGTGYVYPPVIVDSDWIGYPPTYGYGWGMAVGAFTAFAYGYAAGAHDGYWCHPYWGGYGHGWGYGYSHVNVNSTNFYTHWGTAVHGSSSWGYNAYTGRQWQSHHATAFNPYSGARAVGNAGAGINRYNGNFAAGREGAGYNPTTGRFAAGQKGIAGNAFTGNAAGVNRGVAGNVKTGNAVGWNNGNIYTDHQGNVSRHTSSGQYNSFDRSGWQGQSSAASSWNNRSWNTSRSSSSFSRSDSLDSQGFGRSLGSQRSDSFRSSGGGGFGGRSFGGGGRRFGGGRRR